MGCPKFVPSWVLEFHSVGEFSCRGCELEIQCQIAYPSDTGKVQNLQKMNFLGQFCVNFWRASSTQCLNLKNILHAGGQGRKRTKFFGFYKVRDEGFPPFPKEKIDSGGFCGITFSIFTHTEVRVVFLFFFFF